ncbi:MAG: autotransporter-associated beta strand repeat-containing protein [Verrucomicrobiae bacterium]
MLLGATWSSPFDTTGATNFVKSASGAITTLTSASNSWGTGINTDVLAGSTATGTVSQSLRFNAGGSLTLPAAFTVESGGILATTSTAAPVTITGTSIKTGLAGSDLWVVQGGPSSASTGMVINSQIIDNAGSSLTKVGQRALYLTNTNNTYAGGTYIGDGILNVASEGSLGSGALNFTGGSVGQINFAGGATLQAAGDIALGTRAVTIGQGVSATFDTNGHNISVGGPISGAYSSLYKTGVGTLTLGGANTYTGFTDVTNGTLALDFSAAGAPVSDIINANSLVNLGSIVSMGQPVTPTALSDTLSIQGKAGTANSQSFSGVSPNPLFGSVLVNQGMSHLNLAAGSGGTLTVNLGSLTRSLSGASLANIGLDIAIGSGVTVTTTTSLTGSGLLGTASTGTSINNVPPWVTVNGSSWATLSGNNIIPLADSSYSTIPSAYIGTGNNCDLRASATLTGANTLQSLRFNDTNTAGADVTLTLAGPSVPFLESIYGILVTSHVGAHTSTIASTGNGGFLLGFGPDLPIFQNNTAGDLVISAQRVDTNQAAALSKFGAGRLILTGLNTNTGATYVNEGTVIATGDYTPQVIKTGVLTTTGSTAVTMSDTSGLFLGQVMTGTGMRGGGWSYQVITAINPGVGITLSGAPQTGGNITATFQSGGALGGSGLIGGNGGVAVPVMIGTSGTLQIGNGGTHGSLDPNYTISNLGAFVLNRSDSYNFGNLISGSVVDNSLAGTGNTNTLEITGGNGTGTTTLGFSGTVNGSGAAAQKIYTLTTAGNVYVGQNVTGTNIAANTTVAYVDGLNVYFNNNIATGGATNVTFSTANTYAGTTKITGGSTLLLGSSTALQLSTLNYNTSDNGTLSFGSLTAATLGGLNGDKTLALTNNATAAVALTVGGNQLNTTYSGNLTGTGGSLIKTGIGTLTLSGTNSYTGNTTISQGMLQIGNVAALGTSAGAVSVTANASLDLNGTTIANTNTLALNGSGISGGALTNTSATGATYAGTVTLGSATSIGGTGDITLSLALGTDAFALTKVGADTLTLNGAGSSRTGAVAILNGTVKLGNAAALGTTAVTTTVSSGAALDINAQAVGAQALTLNGQYSSTIGALTNSGAAGSYAGTVALGSASSIGGAGNITLSNAISGAFGLTKVGAGTLILTGATNTSTTTTISSGTLQIGNAGTAGVLGSGAVTDNGTLAFNRTDSVTVSNAISGTGAVTLNSGTLTLGGANTYSGATTVNAGTLKLGAAGALGNGTSNTSGVTVSATGAAFDLNGTTPTATVVLTLNGTGVSSAGALTNSGAATTYAGTVALGADSSIGGAGNITLSNAISGAYGLTKVGAGTLILTGATNGSTTTTISSGTLQIGNAGTAGSLGTGAVTDNGTLVFNRTDTYGGTVSNQIGGTGAVTVNGGTLSLSGANNFAGGVALNVGTLNINNASALGTGTFVITGGTTIDNTSGSAITTGNNAQTWNGDFAFTGANNLAFGTGAVSLGAAAGTRTITVNAGTLTEGGVISSSGGAGITKAGAGALTLSGANTFGGGFILNAGTVNINNSAALGSSSAAFTINGGTIDNTSGAAITTSRYALTLNSDFAFTGTNNLSIGDLYGTVSLGTTAGTSRTITANAGTLALNGVIGNGTTANSLIKAGAGALTLSNANTFTGGMTLNAGTLNINNAAALGTTAGTFTINGGTLAQTANVQTFVTSNYVQAWNGDFGYSGNASMTSGLFGGVDHLGINLGTGAVTLGGTGTTRTITTDGYYGNLIVGGVISNGVTANSLIKNGTGILTLNAANAFTGGITLNAGTLRIGNAAALGNGTLTINGGSLAVNAASFTLSTNNAQVWNGAFSFRPINSTDQWTGGNNLNMGTGAVTLAGNSTVTTVNNYLTEGGAIGDGGNNYGVTWVAGYNGVGPRITLTGASTYHGATVVQSQSGAAFTASNLGMVVMTTGTLANTSSVTVNGGGYFQVGTTNSTNPINPLATLTLGGAGGGVFDFGGGSTGGRQSFTSLTVGSGTDVLFSYLVNSGPSIAFTGANPYTRSVGGVLHYVNLAGSSFTNAPSGAGNVIGTGANAILMGATYSYGNGGSTTDANYFVKAGNGTLTAATASAGVWGTGVNTDVLAGSGAIGSVSQSLRFNTGGSLTLPGAFTVESGGILATHNTAIPVTITGGTLATGIAGSDLWVVQGYYASATTGMIINSQIIDNGGSSLTKSGPRALYLTNTNNTYAGGTYLADGILNVASAGSLGSGALNFTGNANLQAAGNVALGSRAVTIASGLTATLDTNGHAISVGGVVSGVNASLTKTGLGTLTLTGANTYTGITTVQNGTLSLDFSASGAPASDIINANSLLQLGVAGVSDTLIIQGAAGVANSQTFGATNSPLGGNAATTVLGGMNNLVFNAGAGGSLTVNLGNISGGSSSSSYMDVSTSGNVTVAGVNDTTPGSYLDKGFHGSGGNNYAWATVNKSTWATVNTSGNLVGFADSSYTKNTATTIGGMADIVTSGTFAAGSQAQTLRFNDTLATGAGQTLTLNGTKVFQITSGAILMTANAGAHDSTISGGFLTGSNLTQLGIFQNNTLGNLIINSQITDQAGSSGFFKNGAGTVILNGVNVNSASFNVLEGTVIATGNYTQSSVKTIATTLGSNVVTMSDTTGLFIGQEITPIATYLPVPNGGLPNVVTAINPGVSVTISNNASANGTSITAAFQSGGAIGGAAFPASNIIMPSVNIANGATLQIGSAATGNSGGIDPNVTVSNLGALILSHSGNYTFGNTLSGAVATNSLSGTNATNTLEIAGGGSTTLGFNGTVNGSGVAAQNVYTLSTVGNVYKGQLVTGTNIPGGTYVNYVNGLSVTLTNNISTGGASNVTFTTVNTFAGTTNITGGSTLTLGSQLALQNSTLNYTSTGTLSFGTLTAATLGGLSGDKALALTNASAAAVALTVGGNLFDTAYSGNLTGTGGSLTKTGIGSLALSGTNTFTGGTTVSAGTLQIGSATALGDSTSAVSVASGATLDLNGQTVTNTNALTLNGSGFSIAALTNSSATGAVYAGNVTMTGAIPTTIGGSGNITLNGILTGGYGYTPNKVGTGTLILNGANTFAYGGSGFTISAGTVQLGNATALGLNNNVVTVASGAVLDLNGQTVANNYPLTINGTGINSGGALVNSSGTAASYAGTVALGAASSIGGVGAITLSNTISGSYGLTKIGADTLTLSGANTYTGKTDVLNGTVSFTTGNASATGAQSLGANATLDLGVASTSSGILKYTGTGGATLAKNINALGNGSDTIQNSGTGLLTLTGTLTKNGTVLTLKGGTGGITVSGTGTIAGSNAGSDLVVDGGTTTLATANTYNGPTSIINGATLNANAAGALPAAIRSAVSIDPSGSGNSTLALGANQTVASLTGGITSAVHLNANTLTVGTTTGTTTFAGVISGPGGSLIKDGNSTLVLTAANTFNGTTTVSAGTLEAGVTGALGSTSAITVTNTGTLLLSANSATSNSTALTLNGGKVEIKTGTGINTSLGALTLTDNSIIDFGLSSGTDILTLGAVTSWTATKTIQIWNWTGTPRTAGGNEQLMVSSTSGWTANLSSINFYTDSGTTLVGGGGAMFAGYELVAVPEPATWSYMAAIALGGAVLVLRRRRLVGIRN